jgi:hypothetical protein
VERRQSLCKVLGEESSRESTCRVRFRSGGRWRKQGGHVESMRARTFFYYFDFFFFIFYFYII